MSLIHTGYFSASWWVLSIHGRTRKEMSKVPVHWDQIERIREMRDEISAETKIIGNGDILTRAQAEETQEQYGLDGIMIGRGVFQDPFVFAEDSPWASYPQDDKIRLYRRHLELYRDTYGAGERRFDPVKKFMKVYVNGFPGAQDIRAQIALTKSADEAIAVLDQYL